MNDAPLLNSILEFSSGLLDVLELKMDNSGNQEVRLIFRSKALSKIMECQTSVQYDVENDYSSLGYNSQLWSPQLQEYIESDQKDLNQTIKFKCDLGEVINFYVNNHKLKNEGKDYLLRRYEAQDDSNNWLLQEELVKLQDQSRELKKYIESNLQLENFTYIASHDLKAPIRSVHSFLQLLHHNLKPVIDSKNLKFLEIALDASGDMSNIIDDMLTFSKYNTKGTEFKSIDIGFVIDNKISGLEAPLTDKGIEVMRDSMPKKIIGDFDRLDALIGNLISNAIKFQKSESGGQIKLGYTDLDTHHQFWIKDNGIGIEEEFLKEVFSIFKKLHSKTKYTGSGLGLAICKMIVDQHDGQIWVESQLSVGTTFYFTVSKELTPS